MVTSGQAMDNQRQQYIPGPPPPLQTPHSNLTHLPPPPPRPYPGSAIPPPPPGPHPSALPPGTVYGIPGGWQQSWGRPGMGQTLPPPPPLMNHNSSPNQHLQYNSTPVRQPAQLSIPPPPPQYDKPILSATFIPTGDSFGPGVGIPPLDDYSSYSRYDNQLTSEPPSSYSEHKYSDGTPASHSYSYPAPAGHGGEVVNRESRAASASSNRNIPPLSKRNSSEPISPGPPTATLQNPHGKSDVSPSSYSSRQRAQSAALPGHSPIDLGPQWPLDRVLLWLAANGFSDDWQETFKILNLEGTDFLDLGRGPNGRGNLGMMHQTIYPQLAKVCSSSKTGWDQSREREEGKRLRKLISRLVDDAPASAGPGHRRRESGLLPSAGSESTLENSPHLGRPEQSFHDPAPGKQSPAHLGPRNSQGRSSTLPVYSRHASAGTTPVDGKGQGHDAFHASARQDYTRNVLGAVAGRGHSPSLSGDSSTGLAPRTYETSPNASPGLSHAHPASVTSNSSYHPRAEHSKSNSTDSMLKATGHTRAGLNMTGSTESSRTNSNALPSTESSRFYENRRDGSEVIRPSPIDTHRGNVEYAPGPGGKDQSKGFLSKFMRKKHDTSTTQSDDHGLESPTSPASFRQMLPFSKASANGSETSLSQRPGSAMAEEEKAGLRARRGTRSSKRFIFVTPDHWNYRLVDVTDVESAVALRSLICIELGIVDAEYTHIYLTEPGQTEHDEPLNDSALVTARSKADNSGILKLYIHCPSGITPPSTNGTGLGVTFAQRGQAGQPGGSQLMVKSNSAGGVNRDSISALNLSPGAQQVANAQLLQKAAEDYRRQTEAKQKAYLDSRQARNEAAGQYAGIRGSSVIDFDSPRLSPYEDRKTETLVPLRKPPTAPSESSTLTKVNSLRMKTGSGNRASLDALKRLSDPIAEEHTDSGKKKASSPGLSQGIGAALANVGKMAGTPAAAANQTMLPHERNLANKQGAITRGSSKRFHGRDLSGEVSPNSDFPRPSLQTRKSYGPDLEFKETNVAFATSPLPPKDDDSDSDSDDGLFAIPLANKSISTASTEITGKDSRPTLTVDTDQKPQKPRVSFRSPNSSGGMSLSQHRGDESGTVSGEGYDRGLSDGSFSGSAQSPEDRMNRRDSFVSDIWANRPAVENVVDNLDEFFPGVDLDKPFMEEKSDTSSPARIHDQDLPGTLRGRVTFGTEGLPLDFERRNDSDTLGSDESTLKASKRNAVTNVAQRQVEKSGGISRMKSIREVAQKRNDIARGPSVSARVEPNKSASSIVRRKSTKMFGANIVQIKPKPGNRLSTLDPIPQEDIPTDGAPQRQATFRIIRGQLIGKGTYGRVYLGMNATTGEFLAVKQVEVNQKTAGQEKDRIKEMVAALDQEIDTMKDLEHPNIVQYLGCERKEFSISIYLEYIPGGSIGSCLRKHGKFEESVVRSLTRQTLEGLAYLHTEGILHRDLKADNILLDLDGTCKISDFGISKKSDNIYGNDITNSMQGSVFWMAPEVVRSQGQGYSAKVDIWSLGCVVLEMFAGKRPWSREEAIGAIFKLGKLNQAPPIPEDVSATATVDGLNFMYDCFQINPSDRPTADTLLRHSTFCIPDPYYNFFSTNLADRLHTSDVAPLGG